MSISYIPEQESYKEMTPFKRFVLQSFPWINEDFDALTNYELMGKIIEYLNDIISNENAVETNVENLYNSFVSLNNYVSNYFDNLDVQNEINIKLDNMASDGSLEPLINSAFHNYYNETMVAVDEKLETKVDKNGVGQVTMNNLTQDVKEAMTGGSVAVVGYDAIGDFNVMDNSISYSKLNQNGKDGSIGLNITKNLNVDFEQGSRHQTGNLQVLSNTVVTKKTFKPKPRNKNCHK